ncbi:Mov34/MPN/PAD-1 family protein [Croceitalea sp. MTPC9]|uniref:Mov34/MPN/PAD-1 family protein n=1 Tax=unclassified Croceitalea TaxID=2632280 RepID=UPI002B3EEAF8|nr:Mov34/MPN/PAD-1 family protein [Croceitalea sp. MTPC6]GMN16089.1 Mov34/MPN/PAD-1 family protein [Croceitalea sp. MTPC9]
MKSHKLGKYQILISEDVLGLLAKHKQVKFHQKESGGILLGQVRGNEIYILKATVPSLHDKATRTTFDRNKQKSQIIIDYEFSNSDQRTIYLGEWHTHPEKYPTPSSTDLKMIKDQYAKNVLNEPFLILVIQGTKGIYLGLLSRKGLRYKMVSCTL